MAGGKKLASRANN